MEDWIARIYPAADNASLTANAIQGSQHHVLPSTHNIRQLLPYDSREPTPLPDEDDESQQGAEEPYVELRFSRPPSSPHGFLFGRNPQSEVVLPGIVGVSHFHFSITFDDERRLIIKDLQSSVGTQVTYDGMGAGVRRGFSWIIGGDSHILNAEINVMVRKGLQFRIVVASHDMRSKQYMACVDRYRRGQALPQHLFETLELKVRPDTERPTGVHTPKVGEVYLTKVIGHGAFAVVTQFWNVSTGGLHVVKTPLPKLVAQRKVDMDAWNNEIHIMKLISRKRHPHIVEFLGAKPDPYPEISLEYIAGGSLDKYWDISTTESWTILQQCLLALEYLHGHDPPIVHRDIKPANILVCDRRRGLIHVKLADFGLARDYDNLSTICGTRNYLAPEIYANDQYARNGGRDRQSYNASADIWSLGVVVLELECRLPQWQAKYGSLGTFWCEHILGTVNEHLRENPSELGEFLLRKM
ncbi:kinase-like domain [Cordyceps militaris]|uniref:non-specific serine/threonine protein kinase n=1 Tax=Cordyceps militaris TaxID=73501 RepID=A0A2H4SBW3_CORMI|nr:kinase-like domain [Cordyceps militaris]